MPRKSLSSWDLTPATTFNPNPAGTLVWVGPTETPEFIAAYRFCLAKASQIALRDDLQDLAHRPAAHARALIVACQSNEMDFSGLERLDTSRVDRESRFLMLGSICAGQRPHIADEFPGTSFYWHRWNQFLPFQLSSCGVAALHCTRPPRSVAVVASRFSAADPLVELASRFGAAAVWCRSHGSHHGRNFDAVWWDDSVGTPATTKQWLDRMIAMRSPQAEHVWITGTPTTAALNNAQRAGVGCILSKPFRLEPLEQIMGSGQSVDAPVVPNRRVA